MWVPALLAVIFCVFATSENCQIDVDVMKKAQSCVCQRNSDSPGCAKVASSSLTRLLVPTDDQYVCGTDSDLCRCLRFICKFCGDNTTSSITVSCSWNSQTVELRWIESQPISSEEMSTKPDQQWLSTTINVERDCLKSLCNTVSDTTIPTTKSPTMTKGTPPTTTKTPTTTATTLSSTTQMTTGKSSSTPSSVSAFSTTPQTDSSKTQSSLKPTTTASLVQPSTAGPDGPRSTVPNGQHPTTTERDSALNGAAQPSSGRVTTIVAVLLALLVLFAVGVFVFVVLRRQRLACLRPRGEDKAKDVETQACHNQTYGMEVGDSGTSDDKYVQPNAAYTTLSCVNAPATVRLSKLSTDQYSVIRDTDNDGSSSVIPPLTFLYCEAKARHAKENISENPTSNPYEVNDDLDNARGTGEYTKLDFGRNGQGGCGPTSDGDSLYTPLDHSSSSARSSLATRKDEATGVYHDLEEDPSSQTPCQEAPAQKPHDPAAGIYHVLEEDATSPTPQRAEGLYHILEDPPSDEPSVAAAAVYHILEGHSEPQEPGRGGERGHVREAAPTMKPRDGDADVYHVLERDSAGEPPSPGMQRHSEDPDTTLDSGSKAEYNSLSFDRKSSAQVGDDEDTDKVYSHLNEGDEDAYTEVDRQKRREVIDGDYSRIQ